MKLSDTLASELGNQVRMYLAEYQLDRGKRDYLKLKNNSEVIQVIVPKFYSSIVRKACERCDRTIKVIQDNYRVILPIKHISLRTKSGYNVGFCGGYIYSNESSVCSGDGTKKDWHHFIKKEKDAANLLIHLPAFVNFNGY